MIRVDGLAAGVLLREIGAGLVIVPLSCRIFRANEKEEMVADEIFYTTLTNKRQRKL
jgi:hypothetical protein